MSSRKRSHFIQAKDEFDESHTINIPCRVNNIRFQGFDETGKFYCILERTVLDHVCFHVVYYTEQRKLTRQIIEIRIPQSQFGLKKKVFFNPAETKLIYLTEEKVTTAENHQELIVNLYSFELFSKFGIGNCELSLGEPASTLTYSNYNTIDYVHKRTISTLIIYAYRKIEDGERSLLNSLYSPRCSLDIAKSNNDGCLHVKRIEFNLSVFSEVITRRMPRLSLSSSGTYYFYRETDETEIGETLEIKEFDSQSKLRYSYSIYLLGELNILYDFVEIERSMLIVLKRNNGVVTMCKLIDGQVISIKEFNTNQYIEKLGFEQILHPMN
eukprot:TCONS_00005081-protein